MPITNNLWSVAFGALGSLFGGLLGGSTGSITVVTQSFPKCASGTASAPGGLSLVGEPERRRSLVRSAAHHRNPRERVGRRRRAASSRKSQLVFLGSLLRILKDDREGRILID